MTESPAAVIERQPLADVLKSQTSDAHHKAESRLLQKELASGEIAADMLAAYLGQLYLVHAALENRLVASPREKQAIQFEDRHCHSERLAEDLRTFNVDVEGIEPIDSTQAFIRSMNEMSTKEPAAILGVFYVLEGSMNGNRFIAKALNTRLGSAAGNPYTFTYFDPYGEDQRPCWMSFRNAISEIELSDDERAAVIKAAHETFEAVGDISDGVYQQF